jgi:hypothetical protein
LGAGCGCAATCGVATEMPNRRHAQSRPRRPMLPTAVRPGQRSGQQGWKNRTFRAGKVAV